MDGAVAEEADRRSAVFLLLLGEGHAGGQGNLAAHDAVSAPHALGVVEHVHRPALALGDPGGLAVELGHESFGLQAQGQRVAVVPVAREQPVEALLHPGRGARTDRLLAVVQVAEATDLLEAVHLTGLLFEPADEEHLLQQSVQEFLVVTLDRSHTHLLRKPPQDYCGEFLPRRVLTRILTYKEYAPVLASTSSCRNSSSLRPGDTFQVSHNKN